MFILFYIIFTVICCFFTYKMACYQLIRLDKINSKGFDSHQEYISKALNEIAKIKTEVIKIKKDIYQ